MRPLILAFVLLAVACRPKPEVSSAPDRSEEVTAAKVDPPPGSQELGPVEIVDGGGCGALGVTGTESGANRALRNKAAGMGANYVKITGAVEPHETPGCFDKGYTLRGIAYRAPAAAPAPAPSGSATPAPASSGP
jgi:hypothetical protein